MPSQPGILAPLAPINRYLTFQVRPGGDVRAALADLRDAADSSRLVLGIGRSAVLAAGADIEGLGDFPRHSAPGIDVPSTPHGLWLWLRGTDRGELLHEGRRLGAHVEGAFELSSAIDGFIYDGGRDLGGYIDGTENPTGDDARRHGIVQGGRAGMDGSSFVAVQHWVHDLRTFVARTEAERDAVFGRRHSDNEEIDDAPESAHVKRTAQETFEPEAFMVRRSMPWSEGDAAGLVFVAFGRSFAAFEAVLGRMVGKEDGVTDALFSFTRPVSGAYFWCPPIDASERLDLRALSL